MSLARAAAWCVAAFATALAVVGTSPSPAVADLPPATLDVQPADASPGDVVTVTGRLHLPVCQAPLGQVVLMIADGSQLTVVERFSGLMTFRTEVEIPSDTEPGSLVIQSRCVLLPDPGIGLYLASDVVEVAADDPPPEPTPNPPPDVAEPEPIEEPVDDPTPPPAVAPEVGLPAPVAAPLPPPTTTTTTTSPTTTTTLGPPVEEIAAPAAVAQPPEPGPEAAPTTPPHRSFRNLARFEDLGLDAERAAAGGLIVLVFAVLVGFPATIFNATLRRNYDRIVRRLDRTVPGLPAVRAWLTGVPRLVPLGGFVLAAATAGLLLEDGIGWNRTTAVTFVGLALALGVTAYLGWVPAVVVAERKRIPGRFRSYPMALYLVAGGVVLSLAIDLNPGYLYGLLFAYDVSGPWTEEEDGLTFGWGFAVVLGVAIAGWLVWMPIHDAVADGGGVLMLEVVEVALAVVVVAGIEGAILGLLPFPFTAGVKVRRWNPRIWAALYAFGFLAFTQILLRPDIGYIDGLDPRRLLTSLVAFVTFAGGSIWFWWYCNFRRPASAAAPASVDV